jgi:hypothetical protein
MRSASRRDSSDLAEGRAHLLRIVSAWTGLSGANAEARVGDSKGDAEGSHLEGTPLSVNWRLIRLPQSSGLSRSEIPGAITDFRAGRAQPREIAAPMKPASPDAVAGSRARVIRCQYQCLHNLTSMATQRRFGLIACDRSTRLCLGSSRPIGTGTFCLKSLSTLRKRAWRICACHGTVMDQSYNQEAAVCRANSAASQRDFALR